MIENESTFGKRLKLIRNKNKLTLDEAGKKLGVSRTQLCEYENGLVVPSVSRAAELAKFYGVTVDYLLGEKKNSLSVSNSDAGNESIFSKLTSRIEQLKPHYKNLARTLFNKTIEELEKLQEQEVVFSQSPAKTSKKKK